MAISESTLFALRFVRLLPRGRIGGARRLSVGGTDRKTIPINASGREPSPLAQYVARPPDMSKSPPVVSEFSALASQLTIDAISSTSTKRSRGIFESI